MKILTLLENKTLHSQMLKLQQELIDLLPLDWDVSVTNEYKLEFAHPKLTGKVWFGPVDYADLPEPLKTKAEVEKAVLDNYSIGAGEITPLKAVCKNINTCESSILLADLNTAYQAICIYNGWSSNDWIDAAQLASHLMTDVRPA